MLPLEGLFQGELFVLGLGKSGLSAAQALQQAGYQVWVWDDQDALRDQAAQMGCTIASLQDLDWTRIATMILSPGIPSTYPTPHPLVTLAESYNVEIICDVDVLLRAYPQNTFIGITGTNGKSTTTALLTHLLNQSGHLARAGGNIGVPVLGMPPLSAHEICVLELSSYQLELIKTPNLALAGLTNITPDHLDRHGGMVGYMSAKRCIFDLLKKEGQGCIGIDTLESAKLYEQLKERDSIYPITRQHPLECGFFKEDDHWHLKTHHLDELFHTWPNTFSLQGAHNKENYALAYVLGRLFGIPAEMLTKSAESFPGLSHRQELVAHLGNLVCVNDSKATNASSVAFALASFDNIIWLAGGQIKAGDDYTQLLSLMSKVKYACFYGEGGQTLYNYFSSYISTALVTTLDEAVQNALTWHAQHNDGNVVTLLLAPCAASWDQFRNFEERGDHFKALVNGIKETL